MGIKNLNTLIESLSDNGLHKTHLSYFSGKTLAIDTNVYLYKFLYGKSNHIDGMFFMINKFKKFNITPIFIFDGKPPDEKLDTIKNRRVIKNRLEERLSLLKVDLSSTTSDEEIIEIQREIGLIEKKIIYVNKTIIDKTKKLFDLMGIIYIDADCEAEHYCSKLCNLDLVDGVVSEDMDTIACGSKLVIRNFTNRDDTIESYYYDDIIYDLDLSRSSFIDLCILLGNDYNHRPRGLNPIDIFNIVKEYGSIETILKEKIISNWNCNYERIRSIIKLEDISIDNNYLENQYSKRANIYLLKKFLKTHSSIEEKTYLHRIHLMFFNNKKLTWAIKRTPQYISKFNKLKYKNYTVTDESNALHF